MSVWRRYSNKEAFTITPNDWWLYPANPKAKVAKRHIMIRYNPSDGEHGKFKNENGYYQQQNFICEVCKDKLNDYECRCPNTIDCEPSKSLVFK